MLKRVPCLRRMRLDNKGKPGLLVSAAIAVAAILALAGCSSTIGSGGSATATPSRPDGGKLTVRGCPGPLGTVNDAGTPALILTNQTRNGETHVGDLVQVQVSASYHWMDIRASSNLAVRSPAGIQDSAQDVCAWTFRALSAGAASVHLIGGALCEPNQPCPAYAVLAEFTISIT